MELVPLFNMRNGNKNEIQLQEKSMKVIEEINLNKKYETCPWDNWNGTNFGY